MLCLSSYKTQNNEFYNSMIERTPEVIETVSSNVNNFNTWLLF